MTGGLRIVTYNVHGCVGTDRRLAPARIALVLEACRADVIALQELDVGRRRSAGVDQARSIAAQLGMHVDFCSARDCDNGRYGNAVLSRYPVLMVRGACLPQGNGRGEPRALQWVRVDTPGRPLNVLNTHLGLDSRERMLQAAAIVSHEWIDEARGAIVLCGDFNAQPGSPVHRHVATRLRDASAFAGGRPRSPWGTFHSLLPVLHIDHVFVSPDLRVRGYRVVTSWSARLASDHLPVMVDVELSQAVVR